MHKPLEWWLALIAAVGYVWTQHKEKPWHARVLIASISGGIGASLAPEFAEVTGRSEFMGVLLITAFGYIILDLIGALLMDRKLLKDIVKSRIGGGR
jgi:hypothetical protein